MDNKYDVIIVGGGTGGFMAAIAAAGEGAKTLLIERYGFLGGTATAGGLCNMASFFYKDEQVIRGLPQEFMDRLAARGGATPHLRALRTHGSGYYAALYNRELFKQTALEMVLEAGADILLHTYLADVITEGDRITGVKVLHKSGYETLYANVIIDATGDADVAYMAGAECTMGDQSGAIQPGSLMFDIGNVDLEVLHKYVMSTLDDYDIKTEQIPVNGAIHPNVQQRQFVAQGFYSLFRQKALSGEVYSAKESVLFTTTALPGVVSMNSTRVHFNPVDARSRTEAEIDGRKQAISITDFLRENVPGFERSFLLDAGIEIGFRESRHIVGEYLFTAQDAQKGRHFEDVIARYGFPCDIHKETRGSYYDSDLESNHTVEGLWIENEDAYDLPYRCLLPKKLEGLLVVGKTISVDHIAHGSTRLQPLVMAEGQAAGIAAALACHNHCLPRDIDVKQLQDRLLAKGACLYRNEKTVQEELKRTRQAIEHFLATHDSINSLDDVEWFDS